MVNAEVKQTEQIYKHNYYFILSLVVIFNFQWFLRK